MHTKNVRMRPVPLWGRCTGSTDFTSRKKNTRKTNGATKQHSMRDQRQLWKSFSSSFASFEFTFCVKMEDRFVPSSESDHFIDFGLRHGMTARTVSSGPLQPLLPHTFQ